MAPPTRTELEQAHLRYKEAEYLLREARKDEDRCRGAWINNNSTANMTAWADAADRVEDYIERVDEAWKHLFNVLEDAGI